MHIINLIKSNSHRLQRIFSTAVTKTTDIQQLLFKTETTKLIFLFFYCTYLPHHNHHHLLKHSMYYHSMYHKYNFKS